MSDKNRVLYLICRENIFEPGVLKSQLLELAGQVRKTGKETEIIILNFPLVHKFFKSWGNYNSVKEFCRESGIGLVTVPILPIGRSFMPIWAIPFFLIQTIPVILIFSLLHKIDIVHARGYLSALATQVLRDFGLKFRLVFDMRGLYLLEALTHGHWLGKEKDVNFRAWLKLERYLVRNANSTVVQSVFMEDYVRKIRKESATFVPCCVNTQKFLMGAEERSAGRKGFNIDDKFVVLYSGSLGKLHDPEFIAKFYVSIRGCIRNPHFLVVTHFDPRILVDTLVKSGISTDEFTVLRSPKNLEKILPLGDVGLHVYTDIPATPTVLSVKIGEYLASGLPVIVSRNMISITGLTRSEKVGVVIIPNDPKDIRVKMQQLVKEHKILRKNALKLAKSYFSVKVCARKYLEIYDEITKKNKL